MTSFVGGVFIRISEHTYTIEPDGRLVIPANELAEMGLLAGQSVYLAYIAEHDLTNRYSEFLVSVTSFAELDTSEHIAIPEQLLENAGIATDSDVQIICINGAVIITQEDNLNLRELDAAINQLRSANEITEHLSTSPKQILPELAEIICDMEGDRYDG